MILHSSDKQNTGLKISISLFLCVMLLIGVLFSSYFIATEFDHDCSGEDCPICQMIAVCENFVRQTGAGLFFFTQVSLIVLIAATLCTALFNIRRTLTPVTRKVRLNN